MINEPRCYQCGDTLAGWVAEMAAHVKALDPNHLLTVGEEGFWEGGPQVGVRACWWVRAHREAPGLPGWMAELAGWQSVLSLPACAP